MQVTFGPQEGLGATPATEIPVAAVVVEPINTVAPAAAPVAQPAEAYQVPAVRPVSALAPSGLVLGDKLPEFKDIILPRINIVQNIGELKKSFNPGEIVFGQNVLLFSPPAIDQKTGTVSRAALPPVKIAVLGFRPTRYVEKVQGGVRGLIVNTEADVVKAGGTLDFNEWKLKQASGMRRFEPLAEALVAIERPDQCADDDTTFVYKVGNRKYALAIWALKGTSYTAAAKRVFFTHRAVGCLRAGGYPSYHYAVSTKEEKYPGGNAAWIPICIPSGKSDADFMEFAAGILNG